MRGLYITNFNTREYTAVTSLLEKFPEVHYRVHRRQLLDSIVSQFDPVPTFVTFVTFRRMIIFAVSGYKPHAQPGIRRTTLHRLSACPYSTYLQLPSKFGDCPPAAFRNHYAVLTKKTFNLSRKALHYEV
jgi:hypothetical protein